MDVLVISACSGSKALDEEKLNFEDFKSDDFDEREEQLSDYRLPAKKMYTGQEHEYIKEAVRELEDYVSVDWKIISAGYGMLDSDDEIVPYEVTFNDSEVNTRDWSEEIGIPRDFLSAVEDYDLVIVALGTEYLKGLDLRNREISEDPEIVFLNGKSATRELSEQENIERIPVGSKQQKEFGKMMIRLKGWLLNQYVSNIEGKEDIEELAKDPEPENHFYEVIPSPSEQKTLEDT